MSKNESAYNSQKFYSKSYLTHLTIHGEMGEKELT